VIPSGRAFPPELDPRRSRQPGRRPRKLRALGWLAAIVSVLVFLGSVGGYAAARYYTSQLTRVDIRLPGTAAPPAAADGSQNFLLIGSDTRAGANAQYNAAKGSSQYVSGQRSDTVILAHLPAGSGKATLVSFPRDSWVFIPRYRQPDGKVIPAHQAKLNSAFSEGGPPLLIQTIENLSGLRVDHFVQIDFVGFRDMVNALGGVTICVRTRRADRESGDFLAPGYTHINGRKALAFVRQRYGLPQGDLDRIKDQQYFLSVLLHKVLSAGTLINPFKLNAFLRAAAHAVTVDQGLSINDLKDFALRLRHIDPAHVTFLTVPIANANVLEPDGEDAVALDRPALHRLFAGLRADGGAGGGHRSGRSRSAGPPAPRTSPTTAAAAGQSCAP
jgi:LCP family protein required for cell wall assembly